jgi:hypothetical protein
MMNRRSLFHQFRTSPTDHLAHVKIVFVPEMLETLFQSVGAAERDGFVVYHSQWFAFLII